MLTPLFFAYFYIKNNFQMKRFIYIAICFCCLSVGPMSAFSQTYNFTATRNSVAKLELSVQKKEATDVQLKLINEGIKTAEAAKAHRKTKKYSETWALLAYLYSYKLYVDDKVDVDEWIVKTKLALDTAQQMDKESTNLKYIEATKHNLTLKRVTQAQNAFNAKDYEKALQLYRLLSNSEPKDTIYALNGAVAANFLLRRADAVEFMKRAEANNAQNATIYQTLGSWYAARQETEKAISTYEKGLKFNPDNLFLTNEYINTLLENKLYPKAAEALERNLSSFSNVDRINYLYAYIHQQLKNYDVARNYYVKAIELNNYFYDAYYQLGLVYIDLFKSDKKISTLDLAIKNIQSAYELKPNDKQVVKLLLELYTHNNRRDKMQELSRRLLEL